MDLSEKLVAERRARLAAERLLELKSRELFAANRKLSEHARALSEEIVIQRRVVEDATSVAEELRGENSRVRSDLKRATHAQTVAEHRLWLALETIRDGFAIYDASARLVVANAAYLSVFDGLEEVGPGAHARDILRIGLEEGIFDTGDQPYDAWMDGMLDRWRGDIIEPRVIKLWNGHYIRLVDRRGNDGGVVSLALDITDTIRRERQLREARAKAEAANRAKSAFLANMSHELRTPMNGVVGMAELLGETTLSDEQRLYAETIRSSGESLLLIINDVLDYSKLEAEKLQLNPSAFDLEALAHEVVLMLSPSASEKGITIAVDYDLFLPETMFGDSGRIRQILTNLAGNAVKFTEAGHVIIRVVGLGATDGKQKLTISVEDTGIGIAPEMGDHIFGEFNQVEDNRNRKFEGTGLGLAISRQLVRLMGGDIWLESVPDEGSCFSFTLEFPMVGEPSVAPNLPSAFRRAIVIDADTVSRALLTRQLEVLGLSVTSAGRASEIGDLADASAIFADAGAVSSPVFTPDPATPVVLLAATGGAAETAAASGKYAAVISRPTLRKDLFDALAVVASTIPKPRTIETPASEPRRIQVLAAEDNRTNQLVFSKMVKDFALDITFAGNGREAVEAFRAQTPDIVFMDISMPEMDGTEATRLIRAAEAEAGLPRTPIVALTAHALEGDQEEMLSAGADRYLTKPLRKAAIHEALTEFYPTLAYTSTEPPALASGAGG